MSRETDEHDRVAGRQLAIVVLLLGAPFAVMLILSKGDLDSWVCGGIVFAAIAAAFAWPVAVVRIASGRWQELLERPRDADGTDRTVEKISEGVPLPVAVTEELVGDRERRARLGRSIMIVAAIVSAAAYALVLLGHRDFGSLVCQLSLPAFVLGLVIWYRTL